MAHVDWHCEVCGEDKTSMHGNPDSGLCLDCYEDERQSREYDKQYDREYDDFREDCEEVDDAL